LSDPFTLDEFEDLARARVPAVAWDYVQGGSGRESTIAANRALFDGLLLRPRMLVDVTDVDPCVELLGSRLSMPVGVAPMAYHRLMHSGGESATARAAGDAGVLYVASIFASESLEAIAEAATGPRWLQLYWLRRRDVFADLVHRAKAAGYQALVLTVDAPRVARRPRDIRNSFSLPEGITAANLGPDVAGIAEFTAAGVSAIEAHSRDQFDSSITWADLRWLRDRTSLPLVLKGILTAQDALLAVEHGVDALVVSNHGGRQLDGAVPSLAALPEVVEAVAGRVPVLLDGGIRSGADVAKALALGAAAVLVGRPVLWGLGAAGRDGAAAVLRLLHEEFEEVMVLSGRTRAAHFGADAVRSRG
jgi:4-hydroxymandelate oxidase